MPKNQVKNRETALSLFDIYLKQGWNAFIEHPETETEIESVLTLAVANKKNDFALKILETTPLFNDRGRVGERNVFATCCKTQQWDVARALANQTPKNNTLIQRFMASEALKYKNIDLVEHVINHSEMKSDVVYILLQECAKKMSNSDTFEKLLAHLSTPVHQQDLCELFLWENPNYAKIMLQAIPRLFDQMALHDLAPQGRKNFEIFYAEHPKGLLNASVVDKNSNKADSHTKKM